MRRIEAELAVDNARTYVFGLIRYGASQEELDAAFAAWRKASDTFRDVTLSALRGRTS